MKIHQALLTQARAVRDARLQVEALKRMMFEHRPAFVPAFEHQVAVIEASGFLKSLDEAIAELERQTAEGTRG